MSVSLSAKGQTVRVVMIIATLQLKYLYVLGDVCMNNIMKNTYHRPVTTTWFTKSSNEIGITSISHTVGVATTTTENLILSSRAPEVSPQSDPLQPVTAVEGTKITHDHLFMLLLQ